MKRLNKKGFTLIELLAVIIILAVLSLIAIPAVMGRVRTARQDTFIQQGKTFIEAAQTEYASDIVGTSGSWCKSISTIDIERGDKKSPINNNNITGYVKYDADAKTWKAYISDSENSAEVESTSTRDVIQIKNKEGSSFVNYQNLATDGTCPTE